MMQETGRKTITAVLEAQGEQMKGPTVAFVYQVKRKGMKYPDFITWWPPRDGPADMSKAPRGTLGQTYHFIVEVKSKGEGEKGQYYDLVNLMVADATTAAPKAQDDPQTPRSGPPEAGADAPPWPGGEEARGGSKDKSIEWQVACYVAADVLKLMDLKAEEKRPRELVKILLATALAMYNRKLAEPKPAPATEEKPFVAKNPKPQPTQTTEITKGETP